MNSFRELERRSQSEREESATRSTTIRLTETEDKQLDALADCFQRSKAWVIANLISIAYQDLQGRD